MRNLRGFFISIPLFIFFTIIFSSCIKDNFDLDKWDKEIDYNGSFAFPLLYGELSFRDILDLSESDGYIIENRDGLLSLRYSTSITSANVQDIIQFPDQMYIGNIPNQAFDFSDFNNYGDVMTVTLPTINIPFDMFNAEAMIDSVIMKSGRIGLTMQSTFRHNVDITITFPSITRNNRPLILTNSFDPQSGYVLLPANLADYKIDLTKTLAGYNEVPVIIKATFNHLGSNNSGAIVFDLRLSDLKYASMFGYFGQNTLIFKRDSLDIPIFKSNNIQVERYGFEDPRFNVYYKNSYGIPAEFSFIEFTANFRDDERDHDILAPPFNFGNLFGPNHPFNISYPRNPGNSTIDSIKISKNNPSGVNIAGLINNSPRWIGFSVSAATNTNGATRNNFIIDNSRIEAEIVAEFPLWGYINAHYDSDTSKIDFSDFFKDYDPVKRALIKINMTNGFPVEMNAKLRLVDENYQDVEVFDESIISAAEIDSEGKVTNPAGKITEIVCDSQMLERIKYAKHIIYEIHANTSDVDSNKSVRISKDHKVTFNIGAEADIEFEANIDSISF